MRRFHCHCHFTYITINNRTACSTMIMMTTAKRHDTLTHARSAQHGQNNNGSACLSATNYLLFSSSPSSAFTSSSRVLLLTSWTVGHCRRTVPSLIIILIRLLARNHHVHSPQQGCRHFAAGKLSLYLFRVLSCTHRKTPHLVAEPSDNP